MPSNEVTVIKGPIVPRGKEIDFLEYAYQGNIIYYVRLTDGLIVTKPDDYPKKVEVEKSDNIPQKAL